MSTTSRVHWFSFKSLNPSTKIALLMWITLNAVITRDTQACECGLEISTRIYNGYKPTEIFPWMARLVSVINEKAELCGATMISTQYAVTAGHCVPKSNDTISFVTFATERPFVSNSSQRYLVEKFITDYEGIRGTDIALLKLVRRVNRKPICLPQSGHTFEEGKATMLGYGRTESGRTSGELLAGDVTVPNNTECAKVQRIYPTEMCAGNYGGQPAVCDGDSGGPLMARCSKTGQWVLQGVVASSFDCTDNTTYGIFTRVSEYVDWIQNKTGNSGCCVEMCC